MSAPTILHLGFGAFHRAHQAHYTQDAGGGWRIEAVSMRQAAPAQALNAQGGRFTVVEQRPKGPQAVVIDVIHKAYALPDQPAEIATRMAAPDVAIVTLTVTEKAYGLSPQGGLDEAHPAVVQDLTTPDHPSSPLGVLALGLRERRLARGTGLTVMCCDNLPSNGKVLSKLLDDFLSLQDAELAKWVTQHCRFPDSMVDRITPAATDETRALAHSLTGHEDALATQTEPFRQWVIEDSFAGPRPNWEKAGALIVEDVAPFEMAKLRMLNGAHSLIAYLGCCVGLEAVRDVMADTRFAQLVRLHMQAVAKTVPPLQGLDLEDYSDALVTRFENPAIRHLCSQIAMDGSQKLPQRIFEPAANALARGQDIDSFALTAALWIKHVTGGGGPVSDPLAEALRRVETVEAVLALEALFSHGLEENGVWIEAVKAHLDGLHREGAAQYIQSLPLG